MAFSWTENDVPVETLILLAVALVLIPIGIKVVLAKMATTTFEEFEPTGATEQKWIRAAAELHTWAEERGFEFVGWARTARGALVSCHVAFWVHSDQKVWIGHASAAGRVVVEFCTEFAPDSELTSSSFTDGLVVPAPPGIYRQGFPKANWDQLLRRHTEATEYLLQHGCPEPILDRDTSVAQKLTDQNRRTIDHTRSFRFYSYRYVFWTVVRPRRLRNKSIQDQHEAGLIKMPNDE